LPAGTTKPEFADAMKKIWDSLDGEDEDEVTEQDSTKGDEEDATIIPGESKAPSTPKKATEEDSQLRVVMTQNMVRVLSDSKDLKDIRKPKLATTIKKIYEALSKESEATKEKIGKIFATHLSCANRDEDILAAIKGATVPKLKSLRDALGNLIETEETESEETATNEPKKKRERREDGNGDEPSEAPVLKFWSSEGEHSDPESVVGDEGKSEVLENEEGGIIEKGEEEETTQLHSPSVEKSSKSQRGQPKGEKGKTIEEGEKGETTQLHSSSVEKSSKSQRGQPSASKTLTVQSRGKEEDHGRKTITGSGASASSISTPSTGEKGHKKDNEN
jgi:hypothetical protein